MTEERDLKAAATQLRHKSTRTTVKYDVENGRIRAGFTDHRTETEEHVQHLERVFEQIDRQPTKREHPVFDGILQEHNTFTELISDQRLSDLYHLGAGIMIERTELTCYETLLLLAGELDFQDEVTDPLEKNLLSEQATLRQLQGLAGASMVKEMFADLFGQ